MPYWVRAYGGGKELNPIENPWPLSGNKSICLQLSWRKITEMIPQLPLPLSMGDRDGQPLEEKYVVTLAGAHPAIVYKVYSSKDRLKAEQAMSTVYAVLDPLSRAVLSQELLTVILLPIPKCLDELPLVLSNYVTKLQPGTTEWTSLAQLTFNNTPLAYHLCEFTNMAVLKDLYECGINIAVSHSITGCTLIYLATQMHDECLRETLDVLHRVLTDEAQLMAYVNKPCNDDASSNGARRLQSLWKGLFKQTNSSSSVDEFLSVDKILRRDRVNEEFPYELGAMTPLMLATRKGCVRSVHYLLVAGADPNYQEPVKGMTSLHIAAVTCNVGITKLLLSFDGDLTLIDTDGNTPLDIARERDGEKAMECLEVMETVMKSRERLSSDKTIDPPIHPTADSITLLSLDGGGTRGVVCAYILHYIEKQMRLKTANPNIHIRHYFDWYAASSIGSIIALSMTHSNKTTRRTMAFIVNNRHHVLAGRRLYDGSTLDNFAHAAVGDDDFRSVATPRVLVTTVRADMDPPHLIHITNYREDPGDGREWKAWEAIRASSAAPLFFPSFEQRYVDGGILATNPTQHALHDIHVYNGNKVGLVLSLGTGRHQPSINQCIDLVKPRLGHLLSDLQKDLQFFKGLKCMLVANINNCEDVVSHSKCWCESQGGVYHRLSPPLTQKYELDEKSDEGFVLFFYETYLYVLDINDEISRITNYLISCGPKYKRKVFKSTWV